jgi:predicted nucleotidyltransferase component of viral defense system
MDELLLNELSKELKIAPLNILREEAEMLILFNIAKEPFSKNIIFYGGTALRLSYNCPRFSEDFDFLMTKPVNGSELLNALQKSIQQDTGLSIADLKDKRHTLFALLKLRSSFLKHSLSIKIEISKRKNGITKEFRPLYSPCSPLQPVLYTATLASLEKAKFRALRGRNTPRDWFDAYYLSALMRKPFQSPVKFHYDKFEFKRELKRFLPKDKWQLINELLKKV